MKRKSKYLAAISIIILLICLCSVPALALTESEVQQQVNAVGKEAVTGNIFIWFLCAIAFMKVSQKIDSFMSSLGVNVGHTGGSMLAEAIIAMRSVGAVRNYATHRNRFSGGSTQSASAASSPSASGGGRVSLSSFMKGGIAGMVSRSFTKNAVQNATGSKDGGLGGVAFNASVNKGGGFANRIIGSIATGNISSAGTMSGEKASNALMSYLGYTALTGDSATGAASVAGTPSLSGEDFSAGVEDTAVHSSHAADLSADKYAHHVENIPISDSAGGAIPRSPVEPIPSFSDVEIGGGRITATETTPEHPDGIAMAMYHTGKYAAPQGEYTTVISADGEKWYKQYAIDSVERTPYQAPDGSVAYRESIVKRLPKAPPRKDAL